MAVSRNPATHNSTQNQVSGRLVCAWSDLKYQRQLAAERSRNQLSVLVHGRVGLFPGQRDDLRNTGVGLGFTLSEQARQWTVDSAEFDRW